MEAAKGRPVAVEAIGGNKGVEPTREVRERKQVSNGPSAGAKVYIKGTGTRWSSGQ